MNAFANARVDRLLMRLELQEVFDRYADVLDNDRLEEWPSLFTEDCLYEIIPKENEDAGLPAPVIHCDNARMLRDRVISLREANIYEKPVYRHFTSGLQWKAIDADTVEASSSYMVLNTGQDGATEIYQAGRYQDRLVRTDGGWRFQQRRVIYDTLRVHTLLAVPI